MVWASVAVINDDVAVRKLFQACGPFEFNIVLGNGPLYFPNNLFVRRNFDNRIARTRTDQRVAILESDRAVNASANFVLPNNVTLWIVFRYSPRILGAYQVVSIV